MSVGRAPKHRKTGDDGDEHSRPLPRDPTRIGSTNLSPQLFVYGGDRLRRAHDAVTGVPLTNACRMEPVWMSIAVALP